MQSSLRRFLQKQQQHHHHHRGERSINGGSSVADAVGALIRRRQLSTLLTTPSSSSLLTDNSRSQLLVQEQQQQQQQQRNYNTTTVPPSSTCYYLSVDAHIRKQSFNNNNAIIRNDKIGCEKRLYSSTTSLSSRYAVVDHSQAYENAMKGPHGQHLALARLEGIGKDDKPYDPFEEDDDEDDELAEEDDDDVDDDDEAYGDEIQEAEIVDDESKNKKKDGEDEGYDSDEDYDDDEDDEEDYEEDEPIYNNDGSVRRKKSVLATLRAGFPSGGLFAVIELAGIQHKVTTDDLLVVNRLKPVDLYKIGSVHTLKDVLLVGSSHKTLVGLPTVTGAEVDIMVEEITRDAKVIVFKKRRRKHSQRKNGFRRDVTLLRVLDIRMPAAYKNHDHVGRDMLDELAKSFEETTDISIDSSERDRKKSKKEKNASAASKKVTQEDFDEEEDDKHQQRAV